MHQYFDMTYAAVSKIDEVILGKLSLDQAAKEFQMDCIKYAHVIPESECMKYFNKLTERHLLILMSRELGPRLKLIEARLGCLTIIKNLLPYSCLASDVQYCLQDKEIWRRCIRSWALREDLQQKIERNEESNT